MTGRSISLPKTYASSARSTTGSPGGRPQISLDASFAALLEHIEGILLLPLAGTSRGDIRPGFADDDTQGGPSSPFEVDDGRGADEDHCVHPESYGELVVNVHGVFHGGHDWEADLGEDHDVEETGQ